MIFVSEGIRGNHIVRGARETRCARVPRSGAETEPERQNITRCLPLRFVCIPSEQPTKKVFSMMLTCTEKIFVL